MANDRGRFAFRFWLAVWSVGALLGVAMYFVQLARLTFVLPLD